MHLLLLDTNLFDVITSLGTGLYVHHIEFTSFPLCSLYRNLPAMVPGGEGKGREGEECGGMGLRKTQKFKMTWRDRPGKENKTKANKKMQNRNCIKL